MKRMACLVLLSLSAIASAQQQHAPVVVTQPLPAGSPTGMWGLCGGSGTERFALSTRCRTTSFFFG